jgi:protein-S-isoprenylcysteine O-methyltransferase Ste14
MTKRLSRWGVGPAIGIPATAWIVGAALATRAWPGLFLLSWPPRAVLMTLAVILLALGFPLWLAGGFTVMRAYDRDQLRTSGVFALVRHPVYSSSIVFLLPAVALAFRSWPMLGAPLVAYIIFKRLIRREDEYLEQRFGQAYLDHRARVSELCPFAWLWKQLSR